MAIINLREFYPWYLQDALIEVPDKIAKELFADKRYQKSHKRRICRNKAQYSLDAGDGIESEATFTNMSPHEVLEYKQRFCRLCMALNSLPEKQGKRIEAHYIVGKSRKEIAKAECVSESAINKSIEKGLEGMKKYLKNM